jgi:sec-independent protein translocase protein TatB
MNAAAEDTGVKDVAKDLKNITSPKSMGLDALKGAVDQFEGWDPLKAAKEATSVPEKLSPSEDAKKASAATRKLKKAKAKSSDALNFASVATARDKKLVTSTATATKAAPAKAYPLKAAAKTSPTPAFDKPTASKVTAGSKATPTLKKAIKSSQGDA